MLLTKIREYLSVGLALIAAMALCAVAILSLRNDKLTSDIDTLTINNTILVQTNAESSEAIQTLISQRQIDNRLLQILNRQYEKLSHESSLVRKSMKELKEDDTEFKSLLNRRHPIDVNRLLNSRISSNQNEDGTPKTTE